jgi:peptidoglycan/LPS O-acetylase OafA/YrhL
LVFGSLLLLVLGARPGGVLRRFLENRLLREIGRISYAMYVFHYLIRHVVEDTLFGPSRFPTLLGSQLPGQVLFTLFVMSVSFLAAEFSWHLWEKHFIMLKRFFETGARPSVSTSPAPVVFIPRRATYPSESPVLVE